MSATRPLLYTCEHVLFRTTRIVAFPREEEKCLYTSYEHVVELRHDPGSYSKHADKDHAFNA